MLKDIAEIILFAINFNPCAKSQTLASQGLIVNFIFYVYENEQYTYIFVHLCLT